MLKAIIIIGICLSIINANGINKVNFRLPRNIIPNNYKLDIETDIYNLDKKYFGLVNINVTCIENTSKIILHSKDLQIFENETHVFEINDNYLNEIPIIINETKNYDFIELKSKELFKKGRDYSIRIKFEGVLKHDLVGYYLSVYNDSKTFKKVYTAVTHFEPTDARKAFPCFDEPDFKATFQINLGHKNESIALSNMHLIGKSLKENSDIVWSHFAKSVRMSTYLVAFSISKFVKRTSYSQNGVQINIWCRPSVYDKTELASEFTPQILDFFEKFFKIPYPLKKVDLLALSDFSSGAMENWGLITFRETYLTADYNSSIKMKFNSVSVIAHELAHQWFGNLVTMKWWSDLWLNEGFATFMSQLAVQKLIPEWNSLDHEILINILSILESDCRESSHSVQVPIKNPSEINEIFDVISYQKGSFLLRQMHNFLGFNTFQAGIQLYLSRYQYLNAEQDNLWEALTEIAHNKSVLPKNISVKQIMDTWTKQKGYPIVSVRKISEKILSLTQGKYSQLGNEIKHYNSCWIIPLTYSTEDKINEDNNKYVIPHTWLTCANQPLIVQIHIKKNQWYILNNKFSSLMLVDYDIYNWELLKKTLFTNYTSIPVMTRVQLIVSVLYLAEKNVRSYDFALELLKYLKNEDSYLPIKAALSLLTNMEHHFYYDNNEYYKFQNYVKEILIVLYRKYGGIDKRDPSGSFENVQRWYTITSHACLYNIDDCKSLGTIFHNITSYKISEKETEFKILIYNYAIKSGDQKIWDECFDKMITTNDANERNILLGALGQSPNKDTLNKYLSMMTLNGSKIRIQDYRLVFSSVANSEFGRNVSRNFIFNEIANLSKIFETTPKTMANMLETVAMYTNELADIQKFNKFIDYNEDKYLKNIPYGVQVARELLQHNLKWSEINLPRLAKYLMNY